MKLNTLKWQKRIQDCLDHQIEVSKLPFIVTERVSFPLETGCMPTFRVRYSNGPEVRVVLRFVGFSGKAGSGKDTAADIYTKLLELQKPNNLTERCVRRDAFASTLKEICATLTDTPVTEFETEEGKSKFNLFAGMTNRTIAQLVGTECFRDVFDEDIWINTVINKAIYEALDRSLSIIDRQGITVELVVVISDTRFENEANFIRDVNGNIAMVINENQAQTSAGNAHRSEKLFPLEDSDIIINNDGVSLDNLASEIEDKFDLA